MGALFLSLGVLVAAGIGVAVFEGRGGKDPVPCEQARDDVTTIQHMSHTGRLTAAQVAQLHHDASQLAAIAPTAHGDDAKAITDAATLADRAAVGRKLHTSRLAIEFEAACPQGGSTSGGGLKTY